MRVSMLITTYNRGDLLRRSLDRLSILTQPDELVVVNDGGEDDFSELLGEYSVATGTRCAYHYLDNPRRTTPSAARNHGLAHCAGDWILLSEPEIVFLTDVVGKLKEAAEADEELPVGDRERSWYSTEDVLLAPESAPHSEDESVCDRHTPNEVPAYISMYRRADLEHIGGWDETFPSHWGAEDVDVQMRVGELGVQRVNLDSVRLLHQWHLRGTTQHIMAFAWGNDSHLKRKPYMHGAPDHICSDGCLRARGVIIPSKGEM